MVSRGDRNFGGLWGVLEARGPVPLGSGEFLAGLAKNNNTHTHTNTRFHNGKSLFLRLWPHTRWGKVGHTREAVAGLAFYVILRA